MKLYNISWQLQRTALQLKGVFQTLPNIYDWFFLQKQLTAVDYFHKKIFNKGRKQASVINTDDAMSDFSLPELSADFIPNVG